MSEIGRNQACPCGSGKKYKRCCGRASTAPMVRPLRALLDEAMHALQQNRFADAGRIARDALRQSAKSPEAHFFLGMSLLRQSQAAAAVPHLETALTLGLSDSAAYYHLATARMQSGDFERALENLEQAVSLRPDFADAHRTLADLRYKMGRYEAALTAFEAIPVGERRWADRFNSAQCLYQLRRFAPAIDELNKALRLAPGQPVVLGMLANLYELTHEIDDAASVVDELLRINPSDLTGLTVKARLLRREGRRAEALDSLSGAYPNTGDEMSRIPFEAERARNLDALGDWAAAWEAASIAHRLAAELRAEAFGESALFRNLDAIERRLPELRDFRKEMADTVDLGDRPRPVFIIGFYRSGSTLLEQMLAAHPQIEGLGETGIIAAAEQGIEDVGCKGFPACLAVLERAERLDVLRNARDMSLSAMKKMQQAFTPWVVDKQLFNAFRLPALGLLFPEAIVLRILRHPGDILTSNWMTLFADNPAWADTPAHIVRLLARQQTHIDRMSALFGDSLIALRYEDLVHQPDNTLLKLLGRLGLDMDQACLDYHRSGRVAHTASYEQVNRPVYTHAVERYRNYLPAWPAELKKLLTAVCASTGYPEV